VAAVLQSTAEIAGARTASAACSDRGPESRSSPIPPRGGRAVQRWRRGQAGSLRRHLRPGERPRTNGPRLNTAPAGASQQGAHIERGAVNITRLARAGGALTALRTSSAPLNNRAFTRSTLTGCRRL
jgi:hypothetical protein